MIELSENLTMPSGKEKSRFDRAIPGQSLTKPPNSYPWESPPRFTDANDAMDFYFDKFENNETLFNLFALLESKVPITKIVDSMLLHGFSEGLYTPDVAVLIAEDLMMTLALVAEEAGIEYETGAPDTKLPLDQDEELDDAYKEREDMFMPQVEEKLTEVRESQNPKGLMGPRGTE